MTERFEIHAQYPSNNYPTMDRIAENIVGRPRDWSGYGFGVRDIGWMANNEFEAYKVCKDLKKAGFESKVQKRKGP